MTTHDLLSKELSNMYALSKQIITYFDESEIDFLPEGTQLLLVKYLALNCLNKEIISEALSSLKINPGNTTDSIVEEITNNLKAIVNENINKTVKTKGYLMSLNRMLGYQLSNIENVHFLSGNDDVLSSIFESESELRQLKKGLFTLK